MDVCVLPLTSHDIRWDRTPACGVSHLGSRVSAVLVAVQCAVQYRPRAVKHEIWEKMGQFIRKDMFHPKYQRPIGSW
jgi:hypothetical protein